MKSVSFHNASKGVVYTFDYPCQENKESCYPYSGFLPKGIFQFEVYGAEGGRAYHLETNESSNGGFGGYSTGILSNPFKTKIYIRVGAMGVTSNSSFNDPTTTVFNGGGFGRNSKDQHYNASSGGGASDIRISVDDIYHRVIVAGGGGGTGYYNMSQKGGNGGGDIGENGEDSIYNGNPDHAGIGANQTNGFSFGDGENRTNYDGCGGGGGWYGGFSGYGYNNPGGGGSGFVFTQQNAEIANAANLSLPIIYYLEDAYTEPSNHTSDGKIIITVIYAIPTSYSQNIHIPNAFLIYLGYPSIFIKP